MKTSDKLSIATFVSLIPLAITMWLLYIYQTQVLWWWLMMICFAIFFVLGLAAHAAEDNEPKPPFYI